VALFHFGHGGAYWDLVPGIGWFWGAFNLIDSNEQEIYAASIYEETVLSRHFFVFVWTCRQGQCIGYPVGPLVGMPLAWTQKTDLSTDGYHDPDNGIQCFISFEDASPTLTNSSFRYTTVEGKEFIKKFYYYALIQNYSVNDALDSASGDLFGSAFDDCPLGEGFETWWPYNYGFGMGPDWYEGRMRVYGNGDIYLYQVSLTVDADPEFEEEVYIDGQYTGTTGQSFYVNAGSHELEVSVPDGYGFVNHTYSAGSSTNNPAVLSVSSDMTVTAYYNEVHSLTVLAYNQYEQEGYVPLYIDDEYIGTTGYAYTVEEGYHKIYVESPLWDYPYYAHAFEYYTYDSTTNYSNPITLPITDDKTVTAHYITVPLM